MVWVSAAGMPRQAAAALACPAAAKAGAVAELVVPEFDSLQALTVADAVAELVACARGKARGTARTCRRRWRA